VYIGNGWVLTAAHVGAGPVEFAGVRFEPVAGSELTLDAPGRLGRRADILLFRLDPVPALPPVPIRKRPVPDGERLLLVGKGFGRGKRIAWGGVDGFEWEMRTVKRWGTNLAKGSREELPGPANTLTTCFSSSFDPDETPHEAQGATGDSGGAVFVRGPKRWTLAGIMVAIEGLNHQPKHTALYGNRTRFADLSVYRSQILQVTGLGKPEQRARQPARADTPPKVSAGDAQRDPPSTATSEGDSPER